MSLPYFNRWNEAILFLYEKIKNLNISAGRNVYIEKTGTGTRISVDYVPGVSENTYSSYFKVVDTSTPKEGDIPTEAKIKIIDGFDPESGFCGDALISDKMFVDIPVKEFTITGNCFIYLISTAGETEPNQPTLEKFDTKQVYELGKSKTLISRVKYENGKITDFSQEVHGPITGYIDGGC